ncbi:MAG TPA: glycosyltransferase family 39 protein [Acidimicrobiales bacterium]
MTDVQFPDDSAAPNGAATTVVDAPGWDVYAPDAVPNAPDSLTIPPTADAADGPGADGPRPTFGRRLVRGRPEDPAWVRPDLLALLVGTGVLYIWGLGASGWANSFYSAAVQAGTKSWKAFFFGSFDSSNFITVDKPPASLWVMELSARIFGVNSWSILVPQALEGVATVGVLYACVRRWFSPGAALLSGAVLALTPVATLMFRYNNPDALLTLLLTCAAYATIRALEAGRTRWLVLAGTLVGFGFITKMMQALILMPVLALVYLVAGPPKLGRRIVQLVWTGGALVVAGGWWVAVVELTPAADRPYIGGSTDNSLFNLIFGYNGIGRLSGNETGSVGGRGTAGSVWGPTGWDRLFTKSFGGQISWLIPGALIGLVAVLWLTRRSPRTDRTRSAFVLFGGWLLLTGLILSYAQGIIHPYYTVVLAPAVGALVGMGGTYLWHRRVEWFPRIALGAAVLATAVWSFVLLGWSPGWYPGLRWAILAAGIVATVGIALSSRARGVLAAGIAGLGIAAILAGPAAYAIDTAATAHSGSIPSAGPAIQGGGFGPGGRGGFTGGAGGRPGGFAGRFPGGATAGSFAGRFPGGATAGGFAGGAPAGGFGGRGFPGGGARPALAGGAGGGAAGGLLNASTPGKQLTTLLQANASRYPWVAATTGADTASGYQLAADQPVMAIGGFNGTDPAPTLTQFQRYVAEGKIHYFLGGGGFGPGGGSSTTSSSSAIATWVAAHYTAKTVDGVTVYDLTDPAH